MKKYACAINATTKNHQNQLSLVLSPITISANNKQQAHFKALRTARTLFKLEDGFFNHNVSVTPLKLSFVNIDNPNTQIIQHNYHSQ